MNSKRRLQRNILRKVVGNRGLQSAWKKEKLDNLLDERKDVIKSLKKATKKNLPDRQALALRNQAIGQELIDMGYSLKLGKMVI